MNHQFILNKVSNFPLLGGDKGVGLLLLIIFFSTPLHAQEVIYSGLENPTSIYATQDHLFVVESGKHRILKLDHDGNLLETLGGLGAGDYQFDTPIDIDATNGLKIYISDFQNNRVQVFDRRFQFLSTIQAPRGQRNFKPTQLVVNEFGELFVYDESSNSIFKFDENGRFVESYSIEMRIDQLKVNNDNIELFDLYNGRVQLMTSNGLFGGFFPLESEANHDLSFDYFIYSTLGNSIFMYEGDKILKLDID